MNHPPANVEAGGVLSIEGTRLLLDGQPFAWQGLSFFNALYNPAFNQSEAERERWLRKFQSNGVNALRVWCQWDFPPPYHLFVDSAPGQTMFGAAGDLRDEPFQKLEALLGAARALGMAVEVVAFSHEESRVFSDELQERAIKTLAERLRPYRNLILQIWNEDSRNVARCFEAVKEVDAARLVTNSPGISDVLGDDEQNQMLDLLTPHTSRRATDFWEVGPRQIAMLLEKFGKPVIDDEPVRISADYAYGSPSLTPPQFMEQIRRVRALGAYYIYHHDMFQKPYGHATIPPTGIPDPDFHPFHRQVFDFLKAHPQW